MHMENILNNSIELNNNLEIEKEQKTFQKQHQEKQ